MRPNRTIAAISTSQMPAAIGIIRISGPDALTIIQKCLVKKELKHARMHFRTIYDIHGEKLDEVMVCYFKAPHSFTGEDSVEIHAHGGPVNLSRILAAICEAGAFPAEPGEFSKRAFLNGKIDLTQAESIMDIIHAQNETQCREAQRQLSGSVSESVEAMRASVMSLLCAIEASIDFSAEEELAPLPVERIRTEGNLLLDKIDRMKRAHAQYRASGLRTVFVGRPNAGKSSLFNCLLGHDRAIVTPIAGTTTDTLESQLTIGGKQFCLIDTAGMTESDNPIESIGVTRTRSQLQNADIVIMLIDGASPDSQILDELLQTPGFVPEEFAQNGRLLAVRSKADLDIRPELSAKLAEFIENLHIPVFDVSIITRQGLKELETAMIHLAEQIESHFENVALMTSQRHISHLCDAETALARALQALDAGLPAECIASDLHEAANALALITGAIASEDVINEIFSHFCIGK